MRRASQRIALAAAAVVVGLHVIVGAAALILLPHGFAVTDLHAWSNSILPGLCVASAVAALARLLFFRSGGLGVSALVAAAAGGWTSAIVLGGVLFPVSMPLDRRLVPMAVALALVGVAWWARQRAGASLAALLVGAAIGAAVVYAQRAAPPSTRPAGGALAEVKGAGASDEASSGQVVFPCGKSSIRIKPLLTFESRSPDRTWTLLAPPSAFGPRRSLERFAKTPKGFRAQYRDDGESTLVAARDKVGLDLEAISTLPSPVYSHLNAFTTLHFSFDAALSFGPTGQARFPIEPSDYPSGRPAHLAALGRDLVFRVLRARDAEKGPFTELGAGRLGRDEPLSIEIHPEQAKDAKDKGCRLIFEDWAAQVSTEPSPTAGWGLPQNSVQFFSRGGEALVLLTLAETGPGRGYDSVGHAAGTYRNRLRVEPIR